MLIHNLTSYEEYLELNKKYENIIINVSASWCGPCKTLKPQIEKFLSVIDEPSFIYLKLDHDVYEEFKEFQLLIKVKKIPYFAFLNKSILVDTFISGDFSFVSKKLFGHISHHKNDHIDDNDNFDKCDDF